MSIQKHAFKKLCSANDVYCDKIARVGTRIGWHFSWPTKLESAATDKVTILSFAYQ